MQKTDANKHFIGAENSKGTQRNETIEKYLLERKLSALYQQNVQK